MNVDVLITQEGDVIFKLRLHALINNPVHLFLTYVDANRDTPEATRLEINRTSSISYNNTDTITHIEFRSQIPFQVFRLGIALTSDSVLGPVPMLQEVHSELIVSFLYIYFNTVCIVVSVS